MTTTATVTNDAPGASTQTTVSSTRSSSTNNKSGLFSFMPSVPGQQRADTLAIKEALAQYLSPQDGRLYWAALVDFLTGKITREEWDLEGRKLLGSEQGSE
jgi:hypothetical protein